MALPQADKNKEVAHLLLLACCMAGVMAGACPAVCECKWKNGKESVTCLNANLSTIPTSLDAGTQVIDLTGNNLAEIGRDAFSKAELLNLQKVFVAKCRIKMLDRFAFRKLKNLVELDLSYNILLAVPSHVFDSISELRELKLSGNPIIRILNDAFNHVPQLVRLEMTDCRLTTVEPRAFSGLDGTLEWLKLDKNRIANVKSSTLTSLQNLHGLELSGNPWNCSCSLRNLREWMLRANIPYSLPPVCRYPKRLQGKSWDRIGLDDFACYPAIATVSDKFQGVETGNVTLSCLISGTPDPIVRWYWKNRLLPNISTGVTNSAKKPYVITVLNKVAYLTILNLDIQDAGVYLCTAENNAGKVEANVTLEVSRRVRDAGLSLNVLLVSMIVAVLFVLASCLMVLCVCTAKQKNRVPRARKESYEKMELNHKSVPQTNHATSNHYTEVAVVAPTKQHPRHSEYCGLPADEGDGDDEDETPSTVVSDAKENIVEFTRESSRPGRSMYSELPVQQHVLRKEVLPTGSLYTTAATDDRNYPDLLETSPQPDHGHFFSTLPRARGSRQPAVSESQSPLLTDSRYGSSGGESGGSRRLSAESRSSSYYRLSSVGDQRSSSSLNLSLSVAAAGGSGRAWRHPSLPASPVREQRPPGPVSETPILDLLGQRPAEYSPAATTYDYHAAQLERFLQEYRSLQEQLNKMKQTCENIREPEEPPKSILKNKATLAHSSGESSDPYWVPRNTLYNSGRSDFFPS